MVRNFIKPIFILFIVSGPVFSDMVVELGAGFSFASAYQYFDLKNNKSTNWLEFQNINFVCADTKFGINFISTNMMIGLYLGFLKKYDLYENTRISINTTNTKRTNAGMIFSFPILFYFENNVGPFYYEIGCGPYMTRMNFNDKAFPEFVNTSIFGFLLGAGYTLNLSKEFQLVFKFDFLVNTPRVLFDLMPTAVTNRYKESRVSDVYVYSDPLILDNISFGIGFQYRFGDGIKLF